ncbi:MULTISPECIES: SusC/RagA family TonB-linked outer membrane protein [unclassified Spirosoma]|uniref:SusC/RagA family TonB-linked outer membrane protein n=1 Tax=unclassified Spirosoma TaxID=2621999 RepID=UPI00096864A8|nr:MULTISPECIES: SusC/RagA family TonB-linked outer membrane protein [unclassified Spirosoma]MBN8821071.1 SusC/RagA family TonB-linked outer membrane protein [Spirosoma sp.]OJW79289.1 MAG: SusC/RagA family TonB-linked outer membrane protein [Spirosoma sp. 48-14]
MGKKLLLSLLFVCSICVVTWAQDRKITGKVTQADDGTSLPGVSVVLKGTTVGTVTDSDGGYSLSVPAKGTLTFSFIGMMTKEVELGASSVVNVKLSSDTKQLSEIVVTGTGVATDKRKLAISVESVSAKDLPQAPSASIDQALIGKIAGAQITSRSGTPGADVNILLRGINTINRGTSPMILIDGIQMGATSLQTIDLNSIERVEVVQGAAAATIYGAQGANGVIQLFTKKGKNGQLNIDISSSIAQNTYLNVGGVSKAMYHAFATDANNNIIGSSGKPITYDAANGIYSENVQYNSTDPTATNSKPYNANLQYHDHFAYFFKPANTVNNSIAISGGSQKADFSLSVSNSHQESNIINNGYFDRSNITANIGAQLAKGLTLRSITQLAYTKNTLKTSDRTILYGMLNAYPLADFSLTTTDGSIPFNMNQTIGINASNPSYRQAYTRNNDNKVDIIQNINLNFKFPKFVELDAKYGLNFQTQNRDLEFANQANNANVKYWVTQGSQNFISNYNTANTGDLTKYTNSKMFQNFLATATAVFDLKEDFGSSIPLKSITQALFDYRNSTVKEYTSAAIGLPAAYAPYNAANTTSWRVYRDYQEPFITYGYLINQRFEYGDFAGISGGFRSDYSSAFGQGSKPFTFPRGDAFVRLSALPFWQNSAVNGFLPELKLRAAYGQAGIQPKPFDRYVTITPTTVGNTTAFYYANGQSNPALGVEVSQEIEVGTDMVFSLFKGSSWLNGIALAATYWDRQTKDAIYSVDVAPSVGLGTLIDNAFTLGSNGIQFSLNSTVYNGSALKWNTTINFGKQSSKIISVRGDAPVVVTSNAGSTNYVLKAGEKIGQLYGYKLIHSVDAKDPNGNFFIPQADQEAYTVASNGIVVNKATKQPYFTADKYSFGDPNPKFNMSFINDFSYKNFLTFGFQFDWVAGNHLYNQTKEWMYRDGIHSEYANPITIDGQTGAWTAFYRGVYAQRTANGTKDYFYEDASFLRLRNIQIGLDFAKLFKIPATKKLQLVLAGRNLWTLTKYTGFDPEISSGTSNSAWDRGTDHSTMPNFKSYQATLNIGF